MNFRKSILASLCVTALGALAAPSIASAEVGIYFNVAPPAMRYERTPAPRPGYMWAPGYWDIRGHEHVWRGGHWERSRRGYHYAQPQWTQHNNRWELQRGSWRRGDRDRDGVPNRRDRAPNNSHRR
ncbi:MAG TPA: YXWGXW repeat-containing protein [Steroidobacteraceae bacterium]|nr:YXWGXW repeat-containing protein [Steroidobacteraceae bacterium]